MRGKRRRWASFFVGFFLFVGRKWATFSFAAVGVTTFERRMYHEAEETVVRR